MAERTKTPAGPAPATLPSITPAHRQLLHDAGRALMTAHTMATSIQYLLGELIEDTTDDRQLALLEALGACVKRCDDAVNLGNGDLSLGLLSLAEAGAPA